MKKLLLFYTFFIALHCHAQLKYPVLSENAEINIITIGPGPELYDAFGHTSIQVKDEFQGVNVVFNYGVFDFDTPNFYLKFAQGKLLYKLSASPYKRFIYNYKSQQRWISTQTLNLSLQQKRNAFIFLMNNLEEKNRYYKYDFFYDNCATRPFYAIEADLGTTLQMDYSDQNKKLLTHRDLIHQYIPWNSWGSLGIDIALGSVIDRTATPEEYLFLPNELKYAFAKAQLSSPTGKKSLVLKEEKIFTPSFIHSYSTHFLISPLFILGIISLLIVFKTYKDFKNDKTINILDTILLLITGITGILVALLWFGTDHTATAWNYNLLWAFPFHIIAAFVIAKKNPPQWIYPYMKLSLIITSLLFFHWLVGVQKYALALLPLLIAITVRYIFILKRLKELKE